MVPFPIVALSLTSRFSEMLRLDIGLVTASVVSVNGKKAAKAAAHLERQASPR
jgi:hypothetical protein